MAFATAAKGSGTSLSPACLDTARDEAQDGTCHRPVTLRSSGFMHNVPREAAFERLLNSRDVSQLQGSQS